MKDKKIKQFNRSIVIAILFFCIFVVVFYMFGARKPPVNDIIGIVNNAEPNTLQTNSNSLNAVAAELLGNNPRIICEQSKMEAQQAEVVKDFSLTIKSLNQLNKKLSIPLVYDALMGRYIKTNTQVEIPFEQIKRLAFKFNSPPVSDKDFDQYLLNAEYDLALEHLRKVPQMERVNYIAKTLIYAPSIHIEYLYELNNLSEIVTTADAIGVTINVFNKVTLGQILDRMNHNVNGIWFDGPRVMNFLLLAIESSNYNAVAYWLGRGVTTGIGDVYSKPLLRMKKPKDEKEYGVALDIVKLVVKHIESLSAEEYYSLKSWMKIDDLSIITPLVEESGLAIPLELVQLRANPLVAELNQKLESIKSQHRGCFTKFEILSENNAYLDNLFLDDVKAIQESLNSQENTNLMIINDSVLVNELLALTNERQWNKALIFVLDKHQSADNKALLSFLLEKFLVFDVSLDLIDQLLNEGATFKQTAVFELLLLDRANQLEDYASRGLDLAYVNTDGFSALHLAIIKQIDIELIKYLDLQGVPFIKDFRGYTPVDYANKNDDGSGYAEQIKAYFYSAGVNLKK